MNKREKLERQFSGIVQDEFGITPAEYMNKFIDFLVDKIEQLENPIVISEIEVQEGGETNDNPKEIESKVEEEQ